MKIMTRLLVCAALAAGFAAQDASAVLLTNTVLSVKGIGLGMNYGTPPTFPLRSYDKPNLRIDNGPYSRIAPLGWDLGATWALYGQTNLVYSSFTLWAENGTGRRFNFAPLADSAGLDGWDQDTVEYTNCPGVLPVNLASEPDPAGGVNGNLVPKQQLDWPKIYNNTNLWEVNGGIPAVTANLANNTTDLGSGLDQAASYATPDVANVYGATVNSNLMAWLLTDTDGLVTLIGVGGNNQNWWVGTNGTYANDVANGYVSIQPATLGERCRNSPTLTLVFEVRVALLGGGGVCAGDPGVDIYLSETDTGFDYLLYTNGVYTGQTIAGTGGATNVSFGLKAVSGTYTAVESNLTTTVTRLLPGAPVVDVVESPSITAQPVPYTTATNSVAYYELTVTGDAMSYQWYRNGTPLSDDNHYWGTTTTQLKISPVLASDAATPVDGCYCVITNTCGAVAISTTNGLTIQAARNLVWRGTPSNSWDIATTANWFNSGSSLDDVFQQGDNVLLDDTAVDATLQLNSPYLSPGTITFNASGEMSMSATVFSELSGPNSKLVVNGPTSSSKLVLANKNTFGGGTTVNDGWLRLDNIQALGSGTVNLEGTGLSLVEVQPGGAADRGLPGFHVATNSTLQFNSGGAYSCVIFGPITGPAGTTFTIKRDPNAIPAVADNFRVYGGFTLDADLVLNMGVGSYATYGSGVTQTYNGTITDIGGARLYTRHGSGTIILNAANTFGGGVTLSGGISGAGNNATFGSGTISIEGTSTLFASGGPRTISNSIEYLGTGNNRLDITDTNVLTLSGTFDLLGPTATSAVTRTVRVGDNGTAILSGVISGGAYACNLTKDGNGLLRLDGINTYTGTTTVADGILGGTGTIAGPVVVSSGGSLAPGASVGTLTINNNLTVSGELAIEVNKFLSPGQSNDVVQVSGTLSGAAGGKVTVSHLGPTLTAGDRFVLFPGKTMTGGSALTVSGAGMVWTNKLAFDGSIEVVTPISTTPTNITYSISGGMLTLSWPLDYTTWLLQSNGVSIANSGAWVTIPNSGNTNQFTFPVNASLPNVFFRMLKP